MAVFTEPFSFGNFFSDTLDMKPFFFAKWVLALNPYKILYTFIQIKIFHNNNIKINLAMF